MISKNIAVYWDYSQIWGALLLRALNNFGISFNLLSSQEIASGRLQDLLPNGTLMVPGGWASKKCSLLGEEGRKEIRNFVKSSGRYLGICGGAGLGLTSEQPENSLNICPWYRKRFQDRLVNCSGHMQVLLHKHKDFQPNKKHIFAPVWWPSQFEVQNNKEVQILGTYLKPEDDFWIADLPAASLCQDKIQKWEGLYKINLHPDFLKREPCVIQGRYGQGNYLLSYLHPETPASAQANQWFKQLLIHFCSQAANTINALEELPQLDLQKPNILWPEPELCSAHLSLLGLVQLGQNHFLLNWRKPWLLGWRRGIPGFILNNLLALTVTALENKPSSPAKDYWDQHKTEFKNILAEFSSCYAEYILRERFTLTKTCKAPDPSGSEELAPLKNVLAGPFPGQDGLFGKLAEILQKLIYLQIKNNSPS